MSASTILVLTEHYAKDDGIRAKINDKVREAIEKNRSGIDGALQGRTHVWVIMCIVFCEYLVLAYI
jgi:hypothetical protein